MITFFDILDPVQGWFVGSSIKFTDDSNVTDGSSNGDSNSRSGSKDGGGNCSDSSNDGGREERDGIDSGKSSRNGCNGLKGWQGYGSNSRKKW